ncbi:hypothetical protein EGY19_05285 [Burkholderia multivorans]|uniref:hypothetical protein n=1 Tax=Burkholderia multivorans TaxID=87883 RepID=UPI000F4EE55D|nr:hypothetical protein [Burkholderia multivorans]AYY96922.1 hypothetical protein EGY19_05285 [Burkholderia multivorans]
MTVDTEKMKALAAKLREDYDHSISITSSRYRDAISRRPLEAADAIDTLLAALEAAAADKRDTLARLLTIVEKDSEWSDARSVDWTRGVLMATLKVALAQRQGEGS